MQKEKPPRPSPLGRSLLGAFALIGASVTMAVASGPGSGGADDFDDHFQDSASDTPDAVDEPDVADTDFSAPDDASESGAVEDHSGSGGGDDSAASDHDDAAGQTDDSGGDDSIGGGDSGGEDNSGPGSSDDNGSDPNDDSGGADDGGSNSGSGDDGTNSGSGSGDDDGGGNSGSGGGDGSGSSGSGSGSSDDGDDDNSGSGASGESHSGHGGDHASGSNSGSHSGSNSGSGSTSGGSDDSGGRVVYAAMVEQDEHGNERLSGEALLTGTQAEIEVAIHAGYTPISQQALPSMDCYIVRLALPTGTGVDQAVAELRALAPHAIVAPNNVYHSPEASISTAPASHRARPVRARGTMGIIDTGVDAAAFGEGVVVNQRAFASASPTVRAHGSAVAALAAEHGMRLHVADVFAASATGEQIASAESIAAAFDWMMSGNVAVINVSIEGPNNPVLQALVRRASERGFVIVAAAGNGGPSARPAFPAAFDGALAVTAIDERDRPYIRANRGEYIDYAAHGVDISVSTGSDNLVVSGTSFSAPLVAAQIAARLATPSPERARAVVEEMRNTAIDLGAPGHDPIFGWGAVRD